jgi:hypothetical protein
VKCRKCCHRPLKNALDFIDSIFDGCGCHKACGGVACCEQAAGCCEAACGCGGTMVAPAAPKAAPKAPKAPKEVAPLPKAPKADPSA